MKNLLINKDVKFEKDGCSQSTNYRFVGTSASAPIVSGIVALMLEKDPNLTRAEIEDILKKSADKIGNIVYVNGRNDYYGYGKVNATKIFDFIK